MTTYRLWPATSGPGTQEVDTDNYTLGVEFYVTDSGCTLTEIRFWAATTVTGSDHATRVYEGVTTPGTGTLVSATSVAFPSPLVAGWNTATLTTPLALTANTRYVACVYFTTDNGYTATGAYWSSGAGGSGISTGPLRAPAEGSQAAMGQGSFRAGADGPPSGTFNAANYWIDVTIDDGTSTATRPANPVIVSTGTPAPVWRVTSTPLITAAPLEVAAPGGQAERGTATLGLAARGAAAKRAPETGPATVGLAALGVAGKKAPVGGRCTLGLAGRRSSAPTVATSGRCTLALTAVTRPAALPATTYAGAPTYPAGWGAGAPTYPAAWVAGQPA